MLIIMRVSDHFPNRQAAEVLCERASDVPVPAEAGARRHRPLRARLRVRPGRQHRLLLPPGGAALRQHGIPQVSYSTQQKK